MGARLCTSPPATKSSETDGKWAAPSSVGIFAGYVMHPGYKSKGEYLVWDLLDFARGADLSNFACTLINAFDILMSLFDVSCMMISYILS